MTREEIIKQVDDKISQVFDKYGAFFAFSNDQFDRQKKQNTMYVHFGGGGLVPKQNLKGLMDELDQVIKWKIEQMKTIDTVKLIKYELSNYECYYTGDISDAVKALEQYNISSEQITKVYNETKQDY